MILCRSGRRLIEIIRRLTHLTPAGWVYFILIIAISISSVWLFRMLRIKLVTKKLAHHIANPTLILIPNNVFHLSTMVFCIMLIFLGYLSNDTADIRFFQFFGLAGTVLLLIATPWALYRECAVFTDADNNIYFARYGGLGRMANINELPDVRIVTNRRKKELVWEILYTNGSKPKSFGYFSPSKQSDSNVQLFKELFVDKAPTSSNITQINTKNL